jgi:hypothetical protein
MNVETGTVAVQITFRDYVFPIFGTVFFNCVEYRIIGVVEPKLKRSFSMSRNEKSQMCSCK